MSAAQLLNVRDILRLSIALADQLLRSRYTGRSLTLDELEALMQAARFLNDSNVAWPQIVQEAIDVLAGQAEVVRPEPTYGEAERLMLRRQPSAASWKRR